MPGRLHNGEPAPRSAENSAERSSHSSYARGMFLEPSNGGGGGVDGTGVESAGIAISLALLRLILGYLSIRGMYRAFGERSRHQLWFGLGLSCGTAALLVELLAYVGIVNSGLLQAYVFLSAAIVGVLSLGSAKSFRPVGSRWRTRRTWPWRSAPSPGSARRPPCRSRWSGPGTSPVTRRCFSSSSSRSSRSPRRSSS